MSLLLPYLERVQTEPIVGPVTFDDLRGSAPRNAEVSSWYESLDAENRAMFADLEDGVLDTSFENLDLYEAVREAVTHFPNLVVGNQYERHFRRGEGEGLHSDPHDIVVTQTNGASADFSIYNGKQPTPIDLADGHILLFHGRLQHTVGPAKSRLRIVRAVGLDYVS